jgi:5-methylcytosine-specific restriction endonuclease McrA
VPLSAETRSLLVSSHRFGAEMVDIAERARFKCEYCSADLLRSVDDYEWNWEREHVVPTSMGGPDELANWALSCRACNQLKGAWDPRDPAGSSASRVELVAAARARVQELRAERQRELAAVRALVAGEMEL